MKAKVIANTALRLRETPGGDEIARIPSGGVVEILNWEVDDRWAQVAYGNQEGYAIREFLKELTENEVKVNEIREADANSAAAAHSDGVAKLRGVANGLFWGILIEFALAGLGAGLVSGEFVMILLGILIGLAMGFVPAYIVRVLIDAKADLLEKATQIQVDLAIIRRNSQRGQP